MNLKQLQSTGELLAGIFGTAFAGAVVTTVQAGQIPATWPQVRHVLAGAALAGVMAVFGWLKMKSPLTPSAPDPSAPPKA